MLGQPKLCQKIVKKIDTAKKRKEFNVSFIPFLVFGHFCWWSYENTKILRNLCLHFARQDGQDGKKTKENHKTTVTKIPKTKRQKYEMNETKIKDILRSK